MAATDCIYCLGRRNCGQLTQEHVWPVALGGKTAPALFQSDSVCKRCNELAGLFVDGLFKRSWFIQNEGMPGQQFLDPSKPGLAALVYMGFHKDFPAEPEEVCEVWLGPSGEHIYHVHSRDAEGWQTVAGGDFIRRKRADGGRAYVVLTSDDPYWGITGLLSFAQWFPNAKRRCLTEVIGLDLGALGVLTRETGPISESEHREIAHIGSWRYGQQIHAQVPLQIDFADRFMAKLALGLANSILGDRALRSSYGDKLRSSLWSQSADERAGLDLRGAGYWAQREERFIELAGSPGAWTIFLSVHPIGFGYTVISPSGRSLAMLISDDPSLWPASVVETYREGAAYIAIPTRQRWLGPIWMPNFISHKLGYRADPSLTQLDQWREEAKALPPKRQQEVATT